MYKVLRYLMCDKDVFYEFYSCGDLDFCKKLCDTMNDKDNLYFYFVVEVK